MLDGTEVSGAGSEGLESGPGHVLHSLPVPPSPFSLSVSSLSSQERETIAIVLLIS